MVVNNRVDCKSYTSLHALVDDMFPPFSSHEQVYLCEELGYPNLRFSVEDIDDFLFMCSNLKEEFNSWNYWKMPLLDIDDEISGKRYISMNVCPNISISIRLIYININFSAQKIRRRPRSRYTSLQLNSLQLV